MWTLWAKVNAFVSPVSHHQVLLHLIKYCVKSSNYKFNGMYSRCTLLSTFSPQNDFAHIQKGEFHYSFTHLKHDKLTCLNTVIHGQSVPNQGYHCWQPRSSAVMLVESSSPSQVNWTQVPLQHHTSSYKTQNSPPEIKNIHTFLATGKASPNSFRLLEEALRNN